MSKIEFEWEQIYANFGSNHFNERARVFGGWLVKDRYFLRDITSPAQHAPSMSQTMVFIPDPHHEWKI